MSKAKSPLFPEIRKGFKNTDIRTRKNGSIEIGKKRIPANPQSTAQQLYRGIYHRSWQEWNALSPQEKELYEQGAKALFISGYNLYMKEKLGVIWQGYPSETLYPAESLYPKQPT